jgi:hypothetical protein
MTLKESNKKYFRATRLGFMAQKLALGHIFTEYLGFASSMPSTGNPYSYSFIYPSPTVFNASY